MHLTKILFFYNLQILPYLQVDPQDIVMVCFCAWKTTMLICNLLLFDTGNLFK